MLIETIVNRAVRLRQRRIFCILPRAKVLTFFIGDPDERRLPMQSGYLSLTTEKISKAMPQVAIYSFSAIDQIKIA